jgi:hypothetical protein
MEMRTVYRYEDSIGVGPYQSNLWRSEHTLFDLLSAHNANPDHPAWYYSFFTGSEKDDMPHILSEDYLAACDSRESLDAWFDGWHEVLEANGFRVKEYTVPAENVMDSRSGLQVAFRP